MTPTRRSAGVVDQELGAGPAEALACLHPIATKGATLLRLYATDDADLALARELDASVHAAFTRRLERARTRTSSGELTFDGTALDFIDHRALFSLRDCAARCGATAVLRTSSPLPAQLVKNTRDRRHPIAHGKCMPRAIGIDLSATTVTGCLRYDGDGNGWPHYRPYRSRLND